MYAVISYKEAVENNELVRIYDDATEKHFADIYDAQQYQLYLIEKYSTPADLYIINVISSGGLDINELKKQDALAKLTDEERQLLGV